MLKNIYSVFCSLTLLILLTACEKEGPMGPAGPDGPPGNPGLSSNGVAEVRAYRTNSSHSFRWKQDDLLPEFFSLQISYESGEYQNRVFIPGDNSVPTGAVLVYFEVRVNSDETIWYNLPHNTNDVMYYPRVWFDDQQFNTYVGIDAEVAKGSLREPDYSVRRLRVVVIPAGNVVGNRIEPTRKKQLSLEEVMKKYNITESDFIDLQ